MQKENVSKLKRRTRKEGETCTLLVSEHPHQTHATASKHQGSVSFVYNFPHFFSAGIRWNFPPMEHKHGVHWSIFFGTENSTNNKRCSCAAIEWMMNTTNQTKHTKTIVKHALELLVYRSIGPSLLSAMHCKNKTKKKTEQRRKQTKQSRTEQIRNKWVWIEKDSGSTE